MKRFGHTTSRWFVHKMRSTIFQNFGGAILIFILCTSFSKETRLDTWKIENELFMQRKGKH
jgi:hypothetical protein